MTACETYRDMLSAGLDGELTTAEQDALNQHMDTCADCRSLLDLLAELADAEPHQPMPDTLIAGTMARIAKEPRRNYQRWITLAAGAVACLVLVTAALPSILRMGKGSTEMMAASTDAKSDSAMATYGIMAAEEAAPESAPMTMATEESAAMEEPAAEEAYDAENSVVGYSDDRVYTEYSGKIVIDDRMPEKLLELGAVYLKTEDGYDWYTISVEQEDALAEILDQTLSYCWFNGNPEADTLLILVEESH